MTLDEAIKHCEEKAVGCDECAKEHAQLAGWLKELKILRRINETTDPKLIREDWGNELRYFYECAKCGTRIEDRDTDYCRYCGRRINWNGWPKQS